MTTTSAPETPATVLPSTKLSVARGYLEQAIDAIATAAEPQVQAKFSWKRFLIARLKEASTYRGLMLLLTAVGVALRPEFFDAIVACGMALAGLLGVLFPDAGN